MAQKDTNTELEPVDMRLAIVKPIVAKWMINLYDFVPHPDIIRNGFKHIGITDFLANSCFINFIPGECK